MRLMALLGAGALAAGALGAVPAEAQRYGDPYRGGYGYGDHYRGDYGNRYYRGDRGYRGGYGYRGDYGYRGGYGRGYHRHGYHGRPRVVCRWSRFDGRRCFRAY